MLLVQYVRACTLYVSMYFPLCTVTLGKAFHTSLLPHEKNALVIHTTFVASNFPHDNNDSIRKRAGPGDKKYMKGQAES